MGEEGEERDHNIINIKIIILYVSLHCHHRNDSCIKMGSDESHFNVSSIVKDKDTRLSTNHNLFKEKGEPKRNRAEASAYQPITLYR